MRNHVEISRRRVLWGLGLGMLTRPSLAALRSMRPRGSSAVIRAEAMLLALFGSSRRPHAIGRAYAQSLPRDACLPEPLTRAIVMRPDGDALSFDSIAALRASVAARIRRDFVEDEVVSVDGWLLSVTEARLCALAARTA